MKAMWVGMQDLMANRAKRLAGAHEIHKFNRDTKELLDRLQVGHRGQVLDRTVVLVCWTRQEWVGFLGVGAMSS